MLGVGQPPDTDRVVLIEVPRLDPSLFRVHKCKRNGEWWTSLCGSSWRVGEVQEAWTDAAMDRCLLCWRKEP